MKTRILWCLLLLLPSLRLAAQTGEVALADQYFRDGEWEQALTLYEKLWKEDPGPELYNDRITACYKQLGRPADAEKFLEKLVRRDPNAWPYEMIRADMMRIQGREADAKTLEQEVITKRLRTQDEFERLGAFLVKYEKPALALETYLQGRKVLKSKMLFSADVAGLYARTGQSDKAAEEYVAQYLVYPASLNELKNDVLNLVGPSSKDAIEAVLLDFSQKQPNDLGLRDLLFDFYVLTENFYEAFIQCKAIDKLFSDNGLRMYNFALTLRSNRQYELSDKAFDYIITNRTDSPYYLKSYEGKTVNRETMAFEKLPLDTADIRAAVLSYDELLRRFGREPRFQNSMYRKASLQALYLHELAPAQAELDQLLALRLPLEDQAQARLLQADILLMQKEYKKAELIYTEVAAMFPDGQIGALAKFKEGRLYYYRGDFEMAKARLKSIKDNTSNDISNDAIRLFMNIQDNTGLDSTTTALATFAQLQLKVFQREYPVALAGLDSMLYNFPNHSLTDDILWEKANIFLQTGKVQDALLCLDKIMEKYAEDLLGDDALFTKARIYDYNLNNRDEAMKYYIEFLGRYSGSLHIVTVRKRIRELRAMVN